MMMKNWQLRLLGLLLTMVVIDAPPAEAANSSPETEPGWSIRFYAASIDFDSTAGYRYGSRPDYDLDIGFGLGVNAEYRLSRRLGLDLGILGGAALDVAWSSSATNEWTWTVYDTLSFTPLTAGIDIHLTPDSNVDLYVCPMLAWIHYGGIVVNSAERWTASTMDFDDDLGVGIALGLSVPFGDRARWSFAANLTHFESQLESTDWSEGRLLGDYDATVLGLGMGYRF